MTVTNVNFVSPFYTNDALSVAAKYFPFIQHNADEDILPLVNGRRYLVFKTIELVGRQYADYRSVINPEASLKTMLALQKDNYGRCLIELGNISELDLSCKAIEDWIVKNDLLVYKKNLFRAPYLSIDCTWEEFRAKKKRKFWYNISRSQRILEEQNGEIVFEVVDSSDEITDVLNRCMLLYEKNWNKFTSSSYYLTKDGKLFLRDLLERLSSKNNAEICTLEQHGVLLAFSIGLKYESAYYFYVFSTTKDVFYSKYSVGKIHIRYLLESVINRGFKIFDFMAGEEPYKYEWTKDNQSRNSYYIVKNNLYGRIILYTFNIVDELVTILKNNKFLRKLISVMSS